MGMKRNIDSGRVDSLGRPIKVSGKSGEESVNMKKKALGDVESDSNVTPVESFYNEAMGDTVLMGLVPYGVYTKYTKNLDAEKICDSFSISPDDFAQVAEENPEFIDFYAENGVVDDDDFDAAQSILCAGNIEGVKDEVLRQLHSQPLDKNEEIPIWMLEKPHDEMVDMISEKVKERYLDFVPWGDDDSAELIESIDFSDASRKLIKEGYEFMVSKDEDSDLMMYQVEGLPYPDNGFIDLCMDSWDVDVKPSMTWVEHLE